MLMQSTRLSSLQNNSQYNNDQNNCKDEQQDARLAPRSFLVVARLLKVDMCTTGCVVRDLNVLLDDIKLGPLLVHHVRYVTEELV